MIAAQTLSDQEMKANKRLVVPLCIALLLAMPVEAKKKYPVIQFETTSVDLGTFSQDHPVQTAEVKFRNVGDAKLVINSVSTSCGCTVADYPKDFISPGGEGKIVITYDGSHKFPGPFQRLVRVFSNCKQEVSKIFVVGEMTAMPAD